jgi:hypothetical protein
VVGGAAGATGSGAADVTVGRPGAEWEDARCEADTLVNAETAAGGTARVPSTTLMLEVSGSDKS